MTKTKTDRLSKADVRHAECAGYHSGNHALSVTGDRRYAQCVGCGTFFGVAEVKAATARAMGSGGVTLISR